MGSVITTHLIDGGPQGIRSIFMKNNTSVSGDDKPPAYIGHAEDVGKQLVPHIPTIPHLLRVDFG